MKSAASVCLTVKLKKRSKYYTKTKTKPNLKDSKNVIN